MEQVQEKKQMSDSILLGILLILAGGFLDAYTYLCRGEVFANAQTGNIVLLGLSLAQGQWRTALQYVLPIVVFALGVLLAGKLKWQQQQRNRLHWRQVVLLLEIVLLFGTAFLDGRWNWLVNSIISFVCALQVESFRKIHGNAYASTMCTGNLRIAAEAMCSYQRTGDTAQRSKSVLYYLLVAAFMAGAFLGAVLTQIFAYKAVLLDLLPLILCFVLMFHKEDNMELIVKRKPMKE